MDGALHIRDHTAGFNPRPRAGGDDRTPPVRAGRSSFNPRPRAGGDSPTVPRTWAWCVFQSTPPRGGRLLSAVYQAPRPSVSIHAPARGATRGAIFADCGLGFQSTPPRGGRLDGARCDCAATLVSIHAPARGATPAPGADGPDPEDVSIHAPARGATERVPHLRALRRVSIHAPARGATTGPTAHPRDSAGFNPRPRAGGDLVDRYREIGIFGFNPRPRAGGDSYVISSLTLTVTFQSTPPRGGRPAGGLLGLLCRPVSIHAPARGATLRRCDNN